MRPRLVLARITSEAADEHWRTQMTVGCHQFFGDEPQTLGGGDVGPAPFAYLLAGLVSCTSVTVRMYAAGDDLHLRLTRRWPRWMTTHLARSAPDARDGGGRPVRSARQPEIKDRSGNCERCVTPGMPRQAPISSLTSSGSR
jgi:hypothetical protein